MWGSWGCRSVGLRSGAGLSLGSFLGDGWCQDTGTWRCARPEAQQTARCGPGEEWGEQGGAVSQESGSAQRHGKRADSWVPAAVCPEFPRARQSRVHLQTSTSMDMSVPTADGCSVRTPPPLTAAWKHPENVTLGEGRRHGGPHGTLRSQEVSRRGKSRRQNSCQWLLGAGGEGPQEYLHGVSLGEENALD